MERVEEGVADLVVAEVCALFFHAFFVAFCGPGCEFQGKFGYTLEYWFGSDGSGDVAVEIASCGAERLPET